MIYVFDSFEKAEEFEIFFYCEFVDENILLRTDTDQIHKIIVVSEKIYISTLHDINRHGSAWGGFCLSCEHVDSCGFACAIVS